MTRLDMLIALAQRTGLLRAGQDDSQRLANAVKFTQLAAYELRGDGFAPLRSRDPKDSHGIVAGELGNPTTRERFRIIANLDTGNQSVVFEELPRLSPVRWEAKHDEEFAPVIDPTTNAELIAVLNGAPAKVSSKSDHDAAGTTKHKHS